MPYTGSYDAMKGDAANPTAETKQYRKDLDEVLQRIKRPESMRTSRERSLAITKLQEAIMWLGMDLKAQREEGLPSATKNPYEGSYDPEDPSVTTPEDVNL